MTGYATRTNGEYLLPPVVRPADTWHTKMAGTYSASKQTVGVRVCVL